MSTRPGVARSRDARGAGGPGRAPTFPALRTIALFALAAMLAVLVAMVTWGGLNKTRQPQLALLVAPTNGFAYARAAVRGVAAQVGDSPGRLAKVTLTPAQRKAALESYAREPLSSQGLAITALAAEGDGKTRRARDLMAAALQLSRRDSLVNGWTVFDASRRGDLAAAIPALDRSMVTAPATASVYVPAMVRSLEQPASIPVLAQILARQPTWGLTFWRAAVVARPTIGNAGKLRVRLAQRGEARTDNARTDEAKISEDRDIDRALLATLAERREFDAALALYRSLPGARPPRSREVVSNGDFAATPLWPLFDWEVLATGEYSGTIEGGGQGGAGLVAEALPGSGGAIARQLVVIPAGPMRLRAKLAHPFETDANRLAIRLQCATSDARVFEAEIAATALQHDFAATKGCRYHWLDVLVRPGIAESREPLALRRIAIVPR